jgi:NRAMP (natural resistance-associated macrophage protein)-like metal ion transporter
MPVNQNIQPQPLPLRQKKSFFSSATGSFSWVRKFIGILGPGLVTGAADDDPSGIATYSSVGAQFGYSMLWTMLFIYPFMVGIQEISARLGRVTGCGIAENIRRRYHGWILYVIVLLLLFANIINIGTDIGAMGAAANLLVSGPSLIYCIVLTGVSIILQVYVPFRIYSRVLKWLTLSLFAYVGTLLFVQVNWSKALRGSFVPTLSLDRVFMAALVAVLGTTISPYLFFWQAGDPTYRRPVRRLAFQPWDCRNRVARFACACRVCSLCGR